MHYLPKEEETPSCLLLNIRYCFVLILLKQEKAILLLNHWGFYLGKYVWMIYFNFWKIIILWSFFNPFLFLPIFLTLFLNWQCTSFSMYIFWALLVFGIWNVFHPDLTILGWQHKKHLLPFIPPSNRPILVKIVKLHAELIRDEMELIIIWVPNQCGH